MPTAAEFRDYAQAAMKKAADARQQGDMEAAEFWMETARQYESDANYVEDQQASPSGRLPKEGEIQAAPIDHPDAGYYYHDASTGRWVPTTQADAQTRKQLGEQVIEPKER